MGLQVEEVHKGAVGMSSWEALSHMLLASKSWFAMLSGKAVKGSYGNLKKFGDDALAIEHAYQRLCAAVALAPSKYRFGGAGLHMRFENAKRRQC